MNPALSPTAERLLQRADRLMLAVRGLVEEVAGLVADVRTWQAEIDDRERRRRVGANGPCVVKRPGEPVRVSESRGRRRAKVDWRERAENEE